MEEDGWNINTERPDRLIISHSHKHAMINITWLQWCLQWLETSCATCHCPKLPWALKSKACDTMAPVKNWTRYWSSFLKQTHKYLGQSAWPQMVISHPLSCTSLWKKLNDTMEVKDYTDSYECWDIHILGHTFSKNHLVNSWEYANQAGSV